MNAIDWMGITLAGIGTIGNLSSSWLSMLIITSEYILESLALIIIMSSRS